MSKYRKEGQVKTQSENVLKYKYNIFHFNVSVYLCPRIWYTLLILIIYSHVFFLSSCMLLFAHAWITILYCGIIRNFYLMVSVVFLCACVCCSETVLTKWVAPPKMVYNWSRV